MADTLPDDWDDNPDWSDHAPRDLTAAEMLIVSRAKLGLSQQATADLLGISAATLRNWEQRRTEPDGPARTLIRLLYEHPKDIQEWLTAA
jgi:DNA-binding transcriptional regulator YiaG